MLYGILFLVVALEGCAHISHQDPQTGLELNYTGPAHGAVELVRATDERPYDLASEAMDKGLSTSLARDADGDVRFNAGYGYAGYTSGGNVGGFAPARTNTRYIPGQGFVVDPQVGSTLPALATPPVVTGMPTTQSATGGGAIVPCPKNRVPATSAEQAACAAEGVLALTQSRVR
ncbi:MAG: hypothetical protein NUV84_01845 [Candidatus Uhrbacteria bacterium]|nr:hypothetical protein [Candidatus Uhrbacteria bacterium]